MKKWFISDTHFFHTNIIKYTGRPFKNVNEMNQTLIKNWNSVVDKNDIVFFLGDFGLGTVENLQKINKKLKGKKICIQGNHDSTPSKMYKIGFSLVLESAFIKVGRHSIELIHQPSMETPDYFQLHGHIHEKLPNKIIKNKLNICVEVWNYFPVSEKQIISMLDKIIR